MKDKKIKATENDKGKRFDVFLAEKLKITRSKAQKIIKQKSVASDGKIFDKASQKLNSEKEFIIKPETKKKISKILKTKEKINFKIKIVKEEKDYLVLEKPAGVLVHPTEAGEKNALTHWLLKNFPEIKGVGEKKDRPGIVHRIDKDTSGLLVVAKNQKMFDHLKKQFKNRKVEKYYTTLVFGVVDSDYDEIDFLLDRGKDGRIVARPYIKKIGLAELKKIQKGKISKTEFWVEKRFSRFTLLKVKISTGRTHQIRVHMFAYNHPIVGDKLYFNRKLIKKQDEIGRLFLHSSELCFFDLENKKVCFKSELPKDLQVFLKKLN